MNLLQGKWPRLATLLAVLVAAALVFSPGNATPARRGPVTRGSAPMW